MSLFGRSPHRNWQRCCPLYVKWLPPWSVHSCRAEASQVSPAKHLCGRHRAQRRPWPCLSFVLTVLRAEAKSMFNDCQFHPSLSNMQVQGCITACWAVQALHQHPPAASIPILPFTHSVIDS